MADVSRVNLALLRAGSRGGRVFPGCSLPVSQTHALSQPRHDDGRWKELVLYHLGNDPVCVCVCVSEGGSLNFLEQQLPPPYTMVNSSAQYTTLGDQELVYKLL